MLGHVAIDATIEVEYRQIYLDSGVGGLDTAYDFSAGQRNGLAGAAQPGFVFLTTATHIGRVAVRFEVLPDPPAVDDTWDEIVEVSSDLRGPHLTVSTISDTGPDLTLAQAGPHRIRYSARHFDDTDTPARRRRKVQRDSYLVQLWPAPLAPDVILKQTSEDAQYWHATARDADPADNPTPHDQALAEQHDRVHDQQQQLRAERDHELWRWGGRDPSPALRAVGSPAAQLARLDRDLVDRIEQLTPDQQRRLAVAVARQACAADTDSPLDWSPALDALASGLSLPAPFDDDQTLRDAMFGHRSKLVATVTITTAEPAPEPRRLYTGVPTSAAVRAAAHPDPFTAAVVAVEAWSWTRNDLTFVAQVDDLVRHVVTA